MIGALPPPPPAQRDRSRGFVGGFNAANMEWEPWPEGEGFGDGLEGCNCRLVVRETPFDEALTTTDIAVVKGCTEAVNPAEEAPATMVTAAGTVTTVLLLANGTLRSVLVALESATEH